MIMMIDVVVSLVAFNPVLFISILFIQEPGNQV